MELILTVTVICIVILILMQGSSVPRSKQDLLTGRTRNYSTFLIFLFGFTLTFAAAFREGFQDTGVYKGLYQQVGTDVDKALSKDFAIQDYGFNLFMVFLNHINPEPQFLIVVVSVIIFSGYMIAITKYSRDIPFSLLLILAVDYITANNGLRQVLAGSIFLMALPLLRDRKIIPYVLLALLMRTLHGSAIVMIPLYFILSGKRLNWGIWAFFALVVLCFAAPNLAYQVMGSLLEDSTYAEYLDVESQMGIMRFLVVLVPTLLTMLYCRVTHVDTSLMGKKSPDYKRQRTIDVLINMQMVFLGFNALGMNMVYFARINLYLPCVLALLLPEVIAETFTKESARFVKRTAIVMYLFYHAYQIYTYYLVDGFGGFELIF